MMENRENKTDQSINSAWDHLYANNIAKAECICRDLYQAEPENMNLLRCMAMIAKHKDDLNLCKQIVERIVNLNPGSPEDQLALGIILQKTGHYDEAIFHLRKSLILGLDEQFVNPNLCMTFFDKGDYDIAIEYYHKSPPLFDFNNCLHEHVIPLHIVQAKKYCKQNNFFYQTIEPEKDVRLAVEKHGVVKYTLPESFMTCLRDVIVMPTNYTIIAQEKYLLHDGFDTNSRKSMMLMPSFQYKTEDDRVLVDIPLKKTIIEDEAILFGGGPNFSHCINDWFSKFYVLQYYPELNHLPLLVSSSIVRPIRDLLTIFGISEDRIIWVDQNQALSCNKVWLPSLTHAFQFFSPNYLQFFRKTVSMHAVNSKMKHRLYLGRQKAAYRKLTNEEELVSLLEKYDFQIVIPENFSIQEQINLFLNAEIMVIPTGGGSASSIFAPKDSIFIDLANPLIEAYQYFISAAILELQLHQIVGNAEEVNTGELAIDCDYNIPIQNLEKILSRYFGKK